MLIQFKNARRAILTAGALAAGALAGCQTPGQQFSGPGVARGDTGGHRSPAFAQVEKGQGLTQSVAVGGMPMNMNNGMAMMQPGMSMSNYQMAGQPMMQPGNFVSPVGYSMPGTMPMQSMPMQTMPMQSMPMQTMQSMPMQTMQMMPGTMNTMPAVPMQTMPSMPQATYMLVNTPNGPQYVMVAQEMPAPTPGTTTMPMVTTPAPAATVVPPPTGTPAAPANAPVLVPASNPAPTSPAAPTPAAAVIPAPEPTPPAQTFAAPTFTAPPPVSLPPMTTPPTPAEPAKKPEPLPRSINSKPPTGPSLPGTESTTSNLGAFPTAPATSAPLPVKLPPAGTASDDFIPSAPVFVPSGR